MYNADMVILESIEKKVDKETVQKKHFKRTEDWFSEWVYILRNDVEEYQIRKYEKEKKLVFSVIECFQSFP